MGLIERIVITSRLCDAVLHASDLLIAFENNNTHAVNVNIWERRERREYSDLALTFGGHNLVYKDKAAPRSNSGSCCLFTVEYFIVFAMQSVAQMYTSVVILKGDFRYF